MGNDIEIEEIMAGKYFVNLRCIFFILKSLISGHILQSMVHHFSIGNISVSVAYKIMVCLAVTSVLESTKYNLVELGTSLHHSDLHGVNVARDGGQK